MLFSMVIMNDGGPTGLTKISCRNFRRLVSLECWLILKEWPYPCSFDSTKGDIRTSRMTLTCRTVTDTNLRYSDVLQLPLNSTTETRTLQSRYDTMGGDFRGNRRKHRCKLQYPDDGGDNPHRKRRWLAQHHHMWWLPRPATSL